MRSSKVALIAAVCSLSALATLPAVATDEPGEVATTNDPGSEVAATNPARPAGVDPTTPTSARPTARGPYNHLVFSDEFGGTALNRNKWSPREWGRSGTVAPDTWRYETDNVSVNGRGQLSLAVDKDDAASGPSGDVFTGACVDTQQKYDYRYGTVEARVRLPHTQGHLGAVWMLPTGLQDFRPPNAPSDFVPDGTARDGAEMDIVESFSQRDEYATTLHWDSFYPPHHKKSSEIVQAPNLHDGRYHVFGLTWTPTRLSFTYDGNVVRTVTNRDHISQVLSYPMLSNEILDEWTDGSIHDADLDGPQSKMLVDWVRVYR